MYHLQKYQGIHSRYRCPQCQNRRKTFTLYIDTETNQPLAGHVGKCDRLDKCGYHFTPKMWFGENLAGRKEQRSRIKDFEPKKSLPLNPCSFIKNEVFKASLKHYHRNNLVIFLINLFGDEVAQQLICKYLIGTAKHWPGATVFWQIDINKKVRAGKIMLYNTVTGKRVKQPFNHVAWVHKVLVKRGINEQGAKTKDLPVTKKPLRLDPCSLRNANYKLNQCFFGEHLLAGNDMPVAIVESEKTALIASVYLPKYVWLATGGLGNLTQQKCDVLKGRKVFLFPDLNGFNAWAAKLALFDVPKTWLFDMLELEATNTEKYNGFDIADYLMAGNRW